MENNNQTDLEEVIQEVQDTTPQEGAAEKPVPALDLDKFQSKDDPSVIKIDLSKPPLTNETKENNPNDARVVGGDESPNPTQEQKEVQPEGEVQEGAQAIEEVTEEAAEVLETSEQTSVGVPENVQKLMDFMSETGGDLSDYVNLNKDVSKLDNQDALQEYYKKTKPHLTTEEVNFMIEDKFSYDEDLDDDNDIKRKKLALKEQVAEAKTYLDGQKSKYYEEIKAGSKLTEEQQEAINFFNRYNKESEQAQKATDTQTSVFSKKTEQVFNDKFKGFEYNVGDKRFRFNVKDPGEVKQTQSDINNFVKKFLNEDNEMSDAKGYHKGLYTAMNADSIANHFYEQGKADAIKEDIAQAKNVNMDPRQTHGAIDTGGLKFRVLGDDTPSFKFKIKNKK
tara:strand:- start:90 stop:1271 length:1182 start_codon:yes stop_codon:yes gene_type:complete